MSDISAYSGDGDVESVDGCGGYPGGYPYGNGLGPFANIGEFSLNTALVAGYGGDGSEPLANTGEFSPNTALIT